jgi:hypothetical protein
MSFHFGEHDDNSDRHKWDGVWKLPCEKKSSTSIVQVLQPMGVPKFNYVSTYRWYFLYGNNLTCQKDLIQFRTGIALVILEL